MNSKIGILYLQINCPIGTSPFIQKYFQNLYNASTWLRKIYEECYVSVGPWQKLIFTESKTVLEYSDYHICFYISDFSGSYRRSANENLIFTNHKFNDKCSTYEYALSEHQFRNRSILNSDKKEIFKIHQEIRSCMHPSFHKFIKNKNLDMS